MPALVVRLLSSAAELIVQPTVTREGGLQVGLKCGFFIELISRNKV